MAWKWRHLRRQTSTPMPAGWPAAARTFRRFAVAINAALITGVLVGGGGGRLFMRIMAATSGDKAQGAVTQAEETVGEITVGGTVALVVFGGIFAGVAVAGIYLLVRRGLPAVPWQAGLMLGCLALGAGGRASELLHPDNRDFTIVRPVGLAVAMIVVLALFFGVVFIAVFERLDRAMPPLAWSPALVAYLPAVLPMIVPPVALLVLGVTGLSTVAHRTSAWWSSDGVARVARPATTVLVVLASAVAIRDAAVILT
jgi:hypothetical protein